MKFVFKLVGLMLCLVLLFFVVSDRLERSTLITEPLSTGIPVSAENTPVSLETSAAPETTAQPTATPAPEPESFTLSFIGDCTLWSNANYAQHSAGFAKTIGEDYSYPFSNTVQYFENDDYTFANLECILSDSNIAYDYTKATFAFIAPTDYANILTYGGVDFVTTANNHLMDCYETGMERTYAALEEHGIPYGGERQSQLVTTDSGLVIGIYTAGTDMRPDWKTDVAIAAIQSMKDQGADYIVCMFHWGDELYYSPYEYETTLARACIDAGADFIYGTHTHCLQPIEEYNGGIIIYSMGNWSFGGSTMPSDPDTAILQVSLKRNADGSVTNDGYNVIPCCVSSKLEDAKINAQNYNDYRPTPYEEGSEEYYRVLAKLDGSFEPDSQGADYSDWWASRG